MYRRRFKRTFRSRRYGRKRSFRRYSSASRSRRIIRKALRRRPIVPEIRQVDRANSGETIDSKTTKTFTVSPATITQGTDIFNRLGQELMFRKFMFHMTLVAPRAENTSTSLESDGYVRVILWTPRIDSGTALNVMSILTLSTFLEWQSITVHRDMRIHLSRPAQPVLTSTGTNNGLYPNGEHSRKFIKVMIPFPRKVKFAIATSSVNPDKDIMYCTVFNDLGNGTTDGRVLIPWQSRVTFIDQ